jgi:hypothetical protein
MIVSWKKKTFKVVILLTLARLIACIPIPGIEFDSLTLTQGGSDDLGMSLLENLAGPQPFFYYWIPRSYTLSQF